MNNYKQNFEQFQHSFKKKEMRVVIETLVKCFPLNPKTCLGDLYRKGILFDPEFLLIDFSVLDIPGSYLLLFKLIKQNIIDLDKASVFISTFSKQQILQGAASFLEKRNTILKYNENWNIKYTNGDQRYLETERQAFYFSSAGIEFQEMLNRFYWKAPSEELSNIVWDEATENYFFNLFVQLGIFNELRDTIEKHLYVDWVLEAINSKTLKIIAPLGQKEGSIQKDLINLMKSKIAVEDIEHIARENLMKGYQDKKPKPKEFWKYVPDLNNEEEMSWFAEALMIDIKADIIVERELALYQQKYFPGINDLNELKLLKLRNSEKLPLRETFRVLAFISELSKKYISEIDDQYTEGVVHYSKIYSKSTDAQIIDINAHLFKGNKEALKETLKEHYNEEVRNEQQQIIAGAKSSINNANCLIRFDLDKLVKTIQWIHQYEEDFIRKVIEIFIYTESQENDVTREPFFRIGTDLCWMPNMVAYASFADNLIENLLAKDFISIHRLQTEYYEKSLRNIFLNAGYKTILGESDRKMRIGKEDDKGDFDLLAWKDGHLVYMELKITQQRNSYYSRYVWKRKKLNEAVDQLKVGLNFINENSGHIKEILGLVKGEDIINVSSFIVSNSYLYDHEMIGGFMKISYLEAIYALILAENINTYGQSKVEKYVQLIKEGVLFCELEKMPVSIENEIIKVGEYLLLRPGLISKNLYNVL